MILWDLRRISGLCFTEMSLCGAWLYLTSCNLPIISSGTLNFEFTFDKYQLDMNRAPFVGEHEINAIIIGSRSAGLMFCVMWTAITSVRRSFIKLL